MTVNILRSQTESAQLEVLQGTTATFIPQWLSLQGEAWAQLPVVESVVLFGSRVTGHATSYSDWDVAVLYRGSYKPSLRRSTDFQEHNVDLACLSMNRFAAESHLVGTLAYELTQDSTVVAGLELCVSKNQNISISEDELKRHLEHAFKGLARAIREIVSGWEFSGYAEPIEEIAADDASGSSTRGAEQTAKALCVYLAVPYAFTHHVEKLAKAVPPEWRSKVIAMNGNTARAHMPRYTGDIETIGDVGIRIERTLDLLSEMLVPCLAKLSDKKIMELTGRLGVSPDLQDINRLLQHDSLHSSIRTLAMTFTSVMDLLYGH